MSTDRDHVAIWNGILDRACAQGPESLTNHERRIYWVNSFHCDYENSGLSGVHYNLSPPVDAPWSKLRSTIEAVTSFGRAEIVSALEEALQIVERLGPDGPTWDDFIAARDPNARLDELDTEIGRHYEVLWDDIEQAALALP